MLPWFIESFLLLRFFSFLDFVLKISSWNWFDIFLKKFRFLSNYRCMAHTTRIKSSRPEDPPARSWGPESPSTSSFSYFQTRTSLFSSRSSFTPYYIATFHSFPLAIMNMKFQSFKLVKVINCQDCQNWQGCKLSKVAKVSILENCKDST